MEQASLFDDWTPAPPRSRTAYPSQPGAKREGTSQDAADAIAPKSPMLRDKVLAELKRGPGTADEIAARLEIDKLSIRPRTTELSLLNLIEDSGARSPNASGKMAIVWRVVSR